VQEFGALGVPFAQREKLTDDYLRAVRAAWEDEEDYRGGRILIWIGATATQGCAGRCAWASRGIRCGSPRPGCARRWAG
jgi:hypothetical protein